MGLDEFPGTDDEPVVGFDFERSVSTTRIIPAWRILEILEKRALRRAEYGLGYTSVSDPRQELSRIASDHPRPQPLDVVCPNYRPCCALPCPPIPHRSDIQYFECRSGRNSRSENNRIRSGAPESFDLIPRNTNSGSDCPRRYIWRCLTGRADESRFRIDRLDAVRFSRFLARHVGPVRFGLGLHFRILSPRRKVTRGQQFSCRFSSSWTQAGARTIPMPDGSSGSLSLLPSIHRFDSNSNSYQHMSLDCFSARAALSKSCV